MNFPHRIKDTNPVVIRNSLEAAFKEWRHNSPIGEDLIDRFLIPGS